MYLEHFAVVKHDSFFKKSFCNIEKKNLVIVQEVKQVIKSYMCY